MESDKPDLNSILESARAQLEMYRRVSQEEMNEPTKEIILTRSKDQEMEDDSGPLFERNKDSTVGVECSRAASGKSVTSRKSSEPSKDTKDSRANSEMETEGVDVEGEESSNKNFDSSTMTLGDQGSFPNQAELTSQTTYTNIHDVTGPVKDDVIVVTSAVTEPIDVDNAPSQVSQNIEETSSDATTLNVPTSSDITTANDDIAKQDDSNHNQMAFIRGWKSDPCRDTLQETIVTETFPPREKTWEEAVDKGDAAQVAGAGTREGSPIRTDAKLIQEVAHRLSQLNVEGNQCSWLKQNIVEQGSNLPRENEISNDSNIANSEYSSVKSESKDGIENRGFSIFDNPSVPQNIIDNAVDNRQVDFVEHFEENEIGKFEGNVGKASDKSMFEDEGFVDSKDLMDSTKIIFMSDQEDEQSCKPFETEDDTSCLLEPSSAGRSLDLQSDLEAKPSLTDVHPFDQGKIHDNIGEADADSNRIVSEEDLRSNTNEEQPLVEEVAEYPQDDVVKSPEEQKDTICSDDAEAVMSPHPLESTTQVSDDNSNNVEKENEVQILTSVCSNQEDTLLTVRETPLKSMETKKHSRQTVQENIDPLQVISENEKLLLSPEPPTKSPSAETPSPRKPSATIVAASAETPTDKTPLDTNHSSEPPAKSSSTETHSPKTSIVKAPSTETPLPEKHLIKTSTSRTPSNETSSPKTPSKITSTAKTLSTETASPKTPLNKPSSAKSPSKETASPKTPSKITSVDKAPSNETASPKTPLNKTSTTKTASNETSSPKTPLNKTPSAKTPSTETPLPKTPSNKNSAKTPSTETPLPKTPSNKTSSVKTSSTKTSSTKTPSTKTTSSKTPPSSPRAVKVHSKTEKPAEQAVPKKQPKCIGRAIFEVFFKSMSEGKSPLPPHITAILQNAYAQEEQPQLACVTTVPVLTESGSDYESANESSERNIHLKDSSVVSKERCASNTDVAVQPSAPAETIDKIHIKLEEKLIIDPPNNRPSTPKRHVDSKAPETIVKSITPTDLKIQPSISITPVDLLQTVNTVDNLQIPYDKESGPLPVNPNSASNPSIEGCISSSNDQKVTVNLDPLSPNVTRTKYVDQEVLSVPPREINQTPMVTDLGIQEVFPVTTPEIQEVPLITEPEIQEPPPVTEPKIQEAPLVNEPEIHEAPLVTEPEIQEVPLVTEPEIQEVPLVTEPEIQEAPLVTGPEIQEAPLVTEPEIQEEPLVTEPEIQEAPLVTEPEIQEAPLVTEPEINEAPLVTEPEIPEAPLVTEPEIPEAPLVTEPEIQEAPQVTEQETCLLPQVTEPEIQAEPFETDRLIQGVFEATQLEMQAEPLQEAHLLSGPKIDLLNSEPLLSSIVRQNSDDKKDSMTSQPSESNEFDSESLVTSISIKGKKSVAGPENRPTIIDGSSTATSNNNTVESSDDSSPKNPLNRPFTRILPEKIVTELIDSIEEHGRLASLGDRRKSSPNDRLNSDLTRDSAHVDIDDVCKFLSQVTDNIEDPSETNDPEIQIPTEYVPFSTPIEPVSDGSVEEERPLTPYVSEILAPTPDISNYIREPQVPVIRPPSPPDFRVRTPEIDEPSSTPAKTPPRPPPRARQTVKPKKKKLNFLKKLFGVKTKSTN